MATLTTKSGDLDIIPEIFLPYMIEKTSEKSEFSASGVIQAMPELAIPAGDIKGGQTVTMPFWQDLAGASQVLDSSTDLSVAKFTTSTDKAVLFGRALVYGSTDLAAALAGSDPIMALADLYAAKWAREWQTLLIQILTGSMAAVTDNILDISGLSGTAAVFDGNAFVDANQKMGDCKDKLVAVAMHSAVEALIAKNDQIDYIKDSEGKLLYKEYQGKRVIVDDGMPVSAGVYTTYLFGLGALASGIFFIVSVVGLNSSGFAVAHQLIRFLLGLLLLAFGSMLLGAATRLLSDRVVMALYIAIPVLFVTLMLLSAIFGTGFGHTTRIR